MDQADIVGCFLVVAHQDCTTLGGQSLLVFNVIPAKAGIQRHLIPANMLGPGNVDSRFRGNDGNLAVQIWGQLKDPNLEGV